MEGFDDDEDASSGDDDVIDSVADAAAAVAVAGRDSEPTAPTAGYVPAGDSVDDASNVIDAARVFLTWALVSFAPCFLAGPMRIRAS